MTVGLVAVRRAGERFLTLTAGVATRHCFSFGPHYDPAHVAHGPLLLCDEHLLAPGAGFDEHRHRDVEVVTWVLEGELAHSGPDGTAHVPAGGGQRMSAGSGVLHAERAGSIGARFVQAWLVPVLPGAAPSYEELTAPDASGSALVPVVSGLGHAGVATLGSRAALHVGRLEPGAAVQVPAAPYLHLLVTRGEVELERAGPLHPGDSALATAAGGLELRSTAPAEVLVWEMHLPAR